MTKLLRVLPRSRPTVFEAMSHPFFDDLRKPTCTLPDGSPLPRLFDFTPEEMKSYPKDFLMKFNGNVSF